MHTKVEVTGQPITTPSTSEAVQQAPTTPSRAEPSVAPTTPQQATAQSPTAVTCTKWMTPAPADVQPLTELMLHLTDLVVSVRHHNALLRRCKYNCDDVTG